MPMPLKCPTENKILKMLQFHSASSATKVRMEEMLAQILKLPNKQV